jgi:hypothetical protein
MIKRIGRIFLFYLLLSVIAGLLFFIYDTFFGSPKWSTIFFAIGIPFLVIYYNITGFVLSLVFFRKKLYIIIVYVLFIINFIFSLRQMDSIYSLVKDIEILKKLHNFDMASLNHNSTFIFSNIISIILILGLFLLIKTYQNIYYKQLIKLNDDKLKKKLLSIDTKDLTAFLKKLKDNNISDKYYMKIEQILGKDYLNEYKKLL